MSAGNGNSRYGEKRSAEFFERHGRKAFTPVFNAHLEAIAGDETADPSERVWALVVLTSWGNHSDCAVDADGRILTQSDIARILGVHRVRVHEAVNALVARNLLRVEGSAFYPIDDPSQVPEASLFEESEQTQRKGETFRLFREQVWTVQHASIEKERAELRARLCEIKRAELAEYKRWLKLLQTPRTNAVEGCSELPADAVRDSPVPVFATPAVSAPPYKEETETETKEEVLSPPAPSLEDDPPSFGALLVAADLVGMRYAQGQLPRLRETFEALPPEERKAARDGLRIRKEIGEYSDPFFLPWLTTYLADKRWTARLTPASRPRKKGPDTSYLDDLIANGGESGHQ
jgi:hypothetical protein